MAMNLERKRKFIINVMFWSICLLLGYLFLRYAIVWIMPFVIAFVFAAILRRPINLLTQRTKINRKVSSVILILAAFIVISLLLWLLGAIIANQLSALIERLPHFATDVLPNLITNTISGVIQRLPEGFAHSAAGFIDEAVKQTQTYLLGLAKTAGGSLMSATTRLPSAMISFMITIIACVFITIDYEHIREFFWRQIPQRFKTTASDTKGFFLAGVGKMLRAYSLLMLITFGELAIFLTLFGVKNSIAIAALISFIDILPILGTGTVLIPWAVISLVMGNWRLALCLFLAYIVITIIRNFLEPKLVSSQIGLHPVLTLMSMYLGLKLIGFAGMFLLPLGLIILIRLQADGTIRLWKE